MLDCAEALSLWKPCWGAAPDPDKGNDSLWKSLHKTINRNRNLMLLSKAADSYFFMARITRFLIYKQKCAAAQSEERGRRIP